MHRSLVHLPDLSPDGDDPSEREAVLAARRADAPPLPARTRPTLGERLARFRRPSSAGSSRPVAAPPARVPEAGS